MASAAESGVVEQAAAVPREGEPTIHRPSQHTVEIVSDSGEGAQKCGQIFGTVSAKMGNGVWTVDIIPAEIQPPRITSYNVCYTKLLRSFSRTKTPPRTYPAHAVCELRAKS